MDNVRSEIAYFCDKLEYYNSAYLLATIQQSHNPIIIAWNCEQFHVKISKSQTEVTAAEGLCI